MAEFLCHRVFRTDDGVPVKGELWRRRGKLVVKLGNAWVPYNRMREVRKDL